MKWNQLVNVLFLLWEWNSFVERSFHYFEILCEHQNNFCIAGGKRYIRTMGSNPTKNVREFTFNSYLDPEFHEGVEFLSVLSDRESTFSFILLSVCYSFMFFKNFFLRVKGMLWNNIIYLLFIYFKCFCSIV